MGFDRPVPLDGYVWWYVDALSDDGQHGLTIIAFIGSVFSPYYAWARRRGPADPLNHCALNVVLYGRRGKRWALTERGRRQVRRGPDALRIGPSGLAWDGEMLSIEIDEVTAPIPSRLRGVVRVRPSAIESRVRALDAAGRHRWLPIAPCARAEVALEVPALRWSGPAYLDTNEGDRPLEDDFVRWNWCRAPLRDGAAVLYEVSRRDGGSLSLAMRYAGAGGVEDIAPPAPHRLTGTRWGVERATRADAAPAVLRTLEDAPFYARSVLATRLLGQDLTAMHESLSLDRFRAPWVQVMLPFRIPRALQG